MNPLIYTIDDLKVLLAPAFDAYPVKEDMFSGLTLVEKLMKNLT